MIIAEPILLSDPPNCDVKNVPEPGIVGICKLSSKANAKKGGEDGDETGAGRTVAGVSEIGPEREEAVAGRLAAGGGRELASRAVPLAAQRCMEEMGHVPMFIDGTALELEGRLFEGAARGCERVRCERVGNFVCGLK